MHDWRLVTPGRHVQPYTPGTLLHRLYQLPTLAQPTEDTDHLIDRAVAIGGAHTIKFTEACLREYILNPKAVYLVAARDAAERVGSV